MSATTATKPRTARASKRRRTSAPAGLVTKKELTVAQAAEQWERARRAIDRNKPLLDEAADVLKEHFAKTGKTTYKDRIALVTGAARLVLDQEKVKTFLGKRLPEFQKRTTPAKSLTLLEK